MKLDIALLTHDLAGVADYARRAAALGFNGLWTSETSHDPYLPLALAAAATTRLQLGTAIATAFTRSPMVTAHLAWDLQKLSNGRFILGLGTQVKAHNERRFSVPFDAPGPRVREAVLGIRAVWDCWQKETKLDFKGQCYRFDLMTPFFNPGPIAQPQIPIFLAGVNPYMCRLAGEVADGLHAHPLNSPKYLREVVLPAVDEPLTRSGRKRRDFTIFTSVFAVVGDSPEEQAESRRIVRQQIALYGSTRTYQPVLAVHGWEGLTPQLHRKSMEGDWAGVGALVSDEMIETYAVTGSHATIGGRIRERYDGLLDRAALYRPEPPPLDDPRWPTVVKAFAD